MDLWQMTSGDKSLVLICYITYFIFMQKSINVCKNILTFSSENLRVSFLLVIKVLTL